METYKKMSVKKLLTTMFDIEKGTRQTVTLFNKNGSACAILGSDGEDVFGRIKRTVAENYSMCKFDDCMFYMTQEEIFYEKKQLTKDRK